MAAREIIHEGGHPPGIFLLPVDPNFNCAICIEVAREPTRCNHDHLFCAGCIGKWLENNQTCPVDRAVLTTRTLSSARIVANFLCGLDVRCLACCSATSPAPLEAIPDGSSSASSSSSSSSSSSTKAAPKKRGTKRKTTEASAEDAPPASLFAWTGKLSELPAHASTCQYILERCTMEGCSVHVQRGDLAAHLSSCAHRLEACEYECGQNVKVCDKLAHQLACQRRPSQCPNAGCGVTLPHNELHAHREQHCLFEEVACPFAASVGCRYRCIRRDMVAHNSDMTAHFAGLMSVVAKVQGLETTIQQQQTELGQQKTAVQQQQTKMQGLETENKQLKETIGWMHGTYTWEVTGCTVPSRMFSPVFNVGGFEFYLELDSDQADEDRNFTGLFLYMKKGWKARVKYELQIINANDSSVSESFSCEYTYERLAGWGCSKLLTNEEMKTYLKVGKVTVRAKVSIKLPDDLASAPVLTR